MKQNRDAWLDLLFSDDIEGGWSNRPLNEDPGGATMHGITLDCYRAWCGDKDLTAEDLQKLTGSDARQIAIAMFWAPLKCDDLPGGIDVYAADFGFSSGWSRAAKELQSLLGVTPDGFIGPKTLTAIRGRNPADLLRDYDDARLEFLEGLKNWDANARGWRKRCRLMRNLAMSKVQSRPALAEVVSSKTIAGGLVAAGGSLVTLLPALQPIIDKTTSDTTALVAQPGLQGHVGAACALAGALYACWRRYRDWRIGNR